jgi:ribose transport system substrate-binding protein
LCNAWPEIGEEIGRYIVDEADARGWDPADTALVQCTDPDNGPDVNIMFETGPEAMRNAGFEIPEENVFDLVCKLAEGRSGETRVVDWFTANPDFEHVAITTIDSPRMQDIINGVEREGRPDEDVILAAASGDDSSMSAVRSGQQDMTVPGFAERYGEYLIPILQDIMAGNPVPSYVGIELVALTADNIDEYYPND